MGLLKRHTPAGLRAPARAWLMMGLGRIACATLIVGACGSSMTSPPASTPTPTPAPPSLGPVQCRQAADCRNSSCFASLPGGMCVNCADDPLGCPSGTICGTDPNGFSATACAQSCARDADCNVGNYCTAQRLCAARLCGSGQPACPAPYVCGNLGVCARPRCADGCPASLTCGAAGFCVEP